MAPAKHTEEVLGEMMGMSEDEIERLKERAIAMAVFDVARSVLFRRSAFPVPHKIL